MEKEGHLAVVGPVIITMFGSWFGPLVLKMGSKVLVGFVLSVGCLNWKIV